MQLRFSSSLALTLVLSLPLLCTDQARKGRGQGQERNKGTNDAGFALPNDEAGALVAKLLSPYREETGRWDRIERPRRFAPEIGPKLPTLPLPSLPHILPRLPVEAKSTPLRPRLTDEDSLSGLLESPLLPPLPQMPVGKPVRIPSANVHEPIPLPILARSVLDRASLEDPTADASAEAARVASIPPRTTPAPFLKLRLPDPYERRRTIKLPSPAEKIED